jgi:hypothetical protein
MFSVRLHEVSGEVLVAACDSEILGCVLDEGLGFRVNEKFYGGDVVDGDSLLEKMESASIVNMIGNRVVDLALKKKLVSNRNVIKVGGVKHAQIVSMKKG